MKRPCGLDGLSPSPLPPALRCLAAALLAACVLGCASEPAAGGSCPTVTAPVGSEPDFGTVDGLYVPMDRVKSAMDAGLRFVFIDARPAGDFAMDHIKGAISLPFFDAESCAAAVPKDVWVIAYCGCPHAESGVVAKAINAAGGKAKVLDEGYIAWKDAGFPITKP